MLDADAPREYDAGSGHRIPHMMDALALGIAALMGIEAIEHRADLLRCHA